VGRFFPPTPTFLAPLLVLKLLSRRPGLHGYAILTALCVEKAPSIPPYIEWRSCVDHTHWAYYQPKLSD
jgi:hypothetical protein